MQRIPEPELMTRQDQAEAYAHANFEAPHSRFIELFRTSFPSWPGHGVALDLGCGPGDIARRFALAYPHCHVDGIDGARAMLEAGREDIASDDRICQRVHLIEANLPFARAPRDRYDAIISNSLLHHLHDPFVLWNAVKEYANPGAPVFVVDLMRPGTRDEANELTRIYAGEEPEVLRHDFFHSLLASFTVDEVRSQLAAAQLPHLRAESISDRHLMVAGTF